MFLNKVKGSSIAEVLIAMTIIAVCFGIASLVIIRSIKVTTNFQDVKKQTEIQSMLWEKLLSDEFELSEINDVEVFNNQDKIEDSLVLYTFKNLSQKTIWEQQWMKYEY